MSKSLGNVISPQDLIKDHGAEMLRLWIASADYTEDVRLRKDTISHQKDIYRRLRNTLRYLLGALSEYDAVAEKIDYDELPDLDRWILHRLYTLNKSVVQNYEAYNFSKLFIDIHHFCALDLSAFYFDIRKDALYCDDLLSTNRRAARFVFSQIIEYLTRWLAPLLCFTAEEVWHAYKGEDKAESIHLETFLHAPDNWQNDRIDAEVKTMRHYRKAITGALEEKRAAGDIRSSLEAQVTLYDPKNLLDKTLPWATLSIVSKLSINTTSWPETAYTVADLPDIAVMVTQADGQKCERCWQILETVASVSHDDGGDDALPHLLCPRCSTVVADYEKAHHDNGARHS